jgi:hypothetical protein
MKGIGVEIESDELHRRAGGEHVVVSRGAQAMHAAVTGIAQDHSRAEEADADEQPWATPLTTSAW